MSTTEERYVFECEWFDEMASLIRRYLFTYYPKNSTVEMVSKQLEYNEHFSLTLKPERCS